jgi:hypothetical protein
MWNTSHFSSPCVCLPALSRHSQDRTIQRPVNCLIQSALEARACFLCLTCFGLCCPAWSTNKQHACLWSVCAKMSSRQKLRKHHQCRAYTSRVPKHLDSNHYDIIISFEVIVDFRRSPCSIQPWPLFNIQRLCLKTRRNLALGSTYTWLRVAHLALARIDIHMVRTLD